mmetsp:Transcript_81468/g.209775  ORF Transcript_81468/g.209775 Transcript_81468/m.209775 type:complete len:224 (+) Transcript_81468:710-1381(+)
MVAGGHTRKWRRTAINTNSPNDTVAWTTPVVLSTPKAKRPSATGGALTGGMVVSVHKAAALTARASKSLSTTARRGTHRLVTSFRLATPRVSTPGTASRRRHDAATPKARDQRTGSTCRPTRRDLCRRGPVKVQCAHKVAHESTDACPRCGHAVGRRHAWKCKFIGIPCEGKHQDPFAAELLRRWTLIPDDIHSPRWQQFRGLAAVEESTIKSTAVANTATTA